MFPALNVITKVWRRITTSISSPEQRLFMWWCIRFVLTPRFQQVRVTLHDGTKWIVPDITSFLGMYRSIYIERIYDFVSPTTTPVIVDCGANIGLSVLFFKRLYPKSRIVAFEADPEIFKILRDNVESAALRNVELNQSAVWNKKTMLSFLSDQADGGRVISTTKGVRVPAVDLKVILQKLPRVTFLKIDIEGGETVVLPHIMQRLKNIPFIFFEYHGFTGKQSALGKMMSRLEDMGFSIHLRPELISNSPFKKRTVIAGMDFQTEVYAWKENAAS